MTDDDKALVETVRLEAEINKNYDSIAYRLLTRIADRIEALSAENQRLREALTHIARLRTDLRGDFSLGSKQSDIARAALGETK